MPARSYTPTAPVGLAPSTDRETWGKASAAAPAMAARSRAPPLP